MTPPVGNQNNGQHQGSGKNPQGGQQGQNPYTQGQGQQAGQPPIPPQGQQAYNPYAQQAGQNPYAQQPAQPPMPPQGQQAYNPYAQQAGQNPYAQQPAQPPMPPQEVVTQPIGTFGMEDGFQTKIKLPAHKLQFDEKLFLKLLAGSISLTKEEKKRIIGAVPQLTQFQVDELIRILSEEKQKFSELDIKHKEQLDGLQGTHHQEWEELEAELTSGEVRAKEQDELAKARAAAQALQNKPKKS